MAAKYPVQYQNPPVIYHDGPLVDRSEARAHGVIRYFTGDPCKYGHIEERWVKSGMCVRCRMERNRLPEYRADILPTLRRWAANNPDKVEAYNAQRRAVGLAKPVKSESRREGLLRHWVERKASAA